MNKQVPHFKIEFDLNFFGGDYSNVGDFVYIPEDFVDQHQSIESAFVAFTDHSEKHIVCTYEDERVDADGNNIEE